MRTENQQAADALMSQINSMSFNANEIAPLLANDHPTLQQSFARLAFAFITAMAVKGKGVDLRNEEATKICQLIHESILSDPDIYRGLPHI